MNILKKWFNRNRESALSGLTSRLPRLNLIPLHQARFCCVEPKGVGDLSILNLSLSGMGFKAHERLRGMAHGSKIQGALQLGEESHPLSAEIVYSSEELMGARFLEMTEELKARILRNFIAEFAAIQMMEVKDSVLAADPDGIPHFLVGQNQCELYFVENNAQVVWFHLTFLGNYIEGDRNGMVKEGWFEDESRRAYKGSTMIRSLRPLSGEMGALALKFLANVRTLDPQIREQLNARIQAQVAKGEML